MNDHRLKPVVSIRSEPLRFHRLKAVVSSRMKMKYQEYLMNCVGLKDTIELENDNMGITERKKGLFSLGAGIILVLLGLCDVNYNIALITSTDTSKYIDPLTNNTTFVVSTTIHQWQPLALLGSILFICGWALSMIGLWKLKILKMENV
jgi:hypothetical protein